MRTVHTRTPTSLSGLMQTKDEEAADHDGPTPSIHTTTDSFREETYHIPPESK